MTRRKRTKELPAKAAVDLRFGTPNEVASYRAERLSADTIIEVGAGAGFQTLEFAKHAKRVLAIEIDEARFARFTAVPQNVTKITGDALDPAIIAKVKTLAKGKTVVFLDPERPAAAQKRTLEEIKPNIKEFIAAYSEITQEIAIELPPFLTDVPDGEREYLSLDSELNRLTLYRGALKRCDISVVRLPSGERIEHSGVVPTLHEDVFRAEYILEPDRALERSGLVPLALPKPCGTLPLGKRNAYVTHLLPHNGFFVAYKILAVTTREELGVTLAGATPILHGNIAQEEQAELLRAHRGTSAKRLHVFLGENVYVTERVR